MTADPASKRWRDPLRLQARRRPAAVALEKGEQRWTYEELDRGADELALHLSESGVEGGDVVATWIEATPAGVAAIHGAPRAGGLLAPGHTRWNEADRSAFVARLRPAAVISDAGSPRPAERWSERRVVLEALGGAELSLFRPTARAESRRAPGNAHTLVWTSGTEGEPRLVCLSGESQLHSAAAANGRLGFGVDDGWMLSLGSGHVGGLAIILRCAVAGARLALDPPRFEPDRTLRLLRGGRVTHVSLVPTMLDQLLETDSGAPLPDSVRCILVGGDAASPDLVSRCIARGWPLALTYGLTEAASQVATAPPALVRRKPGTVGAPLDGVEIRVTEDGEIRVGGSTLMLGYLGDDDVLEGVRDGWVRTGDRGRVDEDGHLWITGRIATRIVSGGSNIDPIEIEEILVTHPRVRAVCVVGVPDEVWGQRVVAVVVPRGLAAAETKVLARELAAWARRRLSGPRYPRGWVFVDRLPLTTSGKPDRAALGRLAGTDAASVD